MGLARRCSTLVAVMTPVYRIAGSLTALVLASASPCGAHGLQANPRPRVYQRATGVVRQAAMPRVVVQGPVDLPPAAHRPEAPSARVLVRDGSATRRSSFGPQGIVTTFASPRRAITGRALVLRTHPVTTLAALFHDANAPPLRVSSVTGRSA
jgi:hypothetical protein